MTNPLQKKQAQLAKAQEQLTKARARRADVAARLATAIDKVKMPKINATFAQREAARRAEARAREAAARADARVETLLKRVALLESEVQHRREDPLCQDEACPTEALEKRRLAKTAPRAKALKPKDEPPKSAKVGRADYEERREARIARTAKRAEKAREEAKAQYEKSHQIVGNIPMGQPILVGHHSEKRHRRDIAKSHQAMGKSVAATKQAERLEQRAASTKSDTAISSDDPRALEKLGARIDELEAERAKIKEISRQLRAGDAETMVRFKRRFGRLSDEELRRGVPSYVLQNLGNNIRRLRERREQLAKTASKPTREPVTRGDWTLLENRETNRVQLKGPRPTKEGKQALKAAGFRWAPSETAWQRQLNERAWYQGEQVLQKLAPLASPPPPQVEPIAAADQGTQLRQDFREHLDAWHRSTPDSDTRRKLGTILLRVIDEHPVLRDQLPRPLLKSIRHQSGADEFAKMDRSYQARLKNEIRSMLEGSRKEYYQDARAVRSGARTHPAFQDVSDATIDTARQKVLHEMHEQAKAKPAPGASLHQRIASALGWPIEETRRFSLLALRDLVRPVDAALAREISERHGSGAIVLPSESAAPKPPPPTGSGSVKTDGRTQIAGAILHTQAAELFGGFRLVEYQPTEIAFEGVVGQTNPYDTRFTDSLRDMFVSSKYRPGSGGHARAMADRIAEILKPGLTTTTNFVRVRVHGAFGRGPGGIDPLKVKTIITFPKTIEARSERDLPGARLLKGTKAALGRLRSQPMLAAEWTRGLVKNDTGARAPKLSAEAKAPAPEGNGKTRMISIREVGGFRKVKAEVHGPVAIHKTGKHSYVVDDIESGLAITRYDSKVAALRLVGWVNSHRDIYNRAVRGAQPGGVTDQAALAQLKAAIGAVK